MKISQYIEEKSIYYLVSCVTFVALSLRLPGSILGEPFHQGEYFAALNSLVHGSGEFLPIVLHGALDYLPGLAGYALFGPDRYMLPVWLFYKLADLAAVLLFLDLCLTLARPRRGPQPAALALALLAATVVEHKDLFLLLAVLLFFRAEGAAGARRLGAEILLGAVMAFGLFWCFDRGLAGLMALGPASLVQAVRCRRFLWSYAVWPAALISLGAVHPMLSLANYARSVGFLVTTSGDWSYGMKPAALAITFLLGAIVAGTLAALWRHVVASRGGRGAILADAILLSCLAVLFLRIGANRADLSHLLSSLWPEILAAAWLAGQEAAATDLAWRRRGLAALAFLAGLFALPGLAAGNWAAAAAFLTLFAAAAALWATPLPRLVLPARWTLAAPMLLVLASLGAGARSGDYGWLGAIAAPPRDEEVAGDALRWVAARLEEHHAGCILDLSNNGVINGLAGLPTCSRFSYPVYADARYQDEIIGALGRRRPGAIVYSSTYWSYAIDNRPMAARMPKLDRFLVASYPREECSLGYCLRYPQDPPREAARP